jgi:hypothetical protein
VKPSAALPAWHEPPLEASMADSKPNVKLAPEGQAEMSYNAAMTRIQELAGCAENTAERDELEKLRGEVQDYERNLSRAEVKH